MSDNFSWQTEDDGSWDGDAYDPQPVKPRNVRPRWLVLLLLMVLLALGMGGYWHFLRRVEALTAVIESDVRSTHNLVARAATLQDLELIAPLLSARDLAWAHGQETLLERGLFYDRGPLGLGLATAVDVSGLVDDEQAVFRLDIAPDMNMAQAQFLQPYAPWGGDEVVLLEQTAVYRRGHNRWLLSPPDDDFWGNWQTARTDRLILAYPARDSQLAQRLAEDLTAVVQQICNDVTGLLCDDGLPLHIRFSPDSAALLLLANKAVLYDGNLRIDLPTPTLVGLPVDEAGYEALLQGYAAVVTAVLLHHQTGWRCCQQASVFQAVVDYELAQNGLRPWPVTAVTYADLINSGMDITSLAPLFEDSSFHSINGPDAWALYLFVDFLMQQYSLDGLDVLASLSEAQSLPHWLVQLLGNAEDDVVFIERLSRDWWLYAHAQMVASQGPRPVPLPAQDLQLTCQADTTNENQHTLYRYRPQQGEWQAEFSLDGYLIVSPLINSSLGSLVQTINFESGLIQPMLWQDGEAIEMSSDYLLSWGYGDPTGRYVLLYRQDGESEAGLWLADLENCTKEGCELLVVSAPLVWSPDGSQALLAVGTAFERTSFPVANGRVMVYTNQAQTELLQLYLADAVGSSQSQQLVDSSAGQLQAILPFWLDNETYGYMYSSQEAGERQATDKIILTSVPSGKQQLLLTSTELLQAIPAAVRPSGLTINHLYPQPDGGALLAVVSKHENMNYIFLVDVASGAVQDYLQIAASDFLHFVSFSPDGRYLLTTGSAQPDLFAPAESIVYHLYDIEKRQTQRLVSNYSAYVLSFPFDWSADGNWLALSLNDGVVVLVAPAYDYQHVVLHNYSNCSSLAWVDTIETP